MAPLSGCFDSDNSWKLIKAIGSSNYVLNPSAEAAGNFATVLAATVTRSTTYQKYGLYSYRIQSTANGDGIELDLDTLANADHYVTLRVREDYPTIQASLNGNIRTLTEIAQIDSDWKLFGVSFGSNLANGATTVEILATDSGDFYIDGIQVEPFPRWTTYIDGTQQDCIWLGSPHASASERSSESRAGGQLIDFWEEYSFQIQRIVGAGASARDLSIDSYSILPGGELNSVKVNSREFTIIGKFIALSEEDLHNKRRALEIDLLESSNVGQQPFKIRFSGGNVQKEISGFYQSGLESDLGAFYGNVEIVENELRLDRELFTENVSIQILSPDPYWYEIGERTTVLDTNDSSTFRVIATRSRTSGQWENLGPPSAAGTYTQVYAIVEDDTYVYIGGQFTNWDGIANADYIVRYDKQTQTYSALGGGLADDVYTLALASNGDLYIGGQFENAGGVANADFLTRWDGSNYNAVGVPLTGAASIGRVEKIQFDQSGILYIVGTFSFWNNIAGADNVVSWNGSSYSALSTGLNATAFSLTVGIDNTIYVGGTFTTPHSRLTAWNGSSFFNPGNTSFDGTVFALTTDPSNGIVYAGGTFLLPANLVAQYNGTSWQNLGPGVNSVVFGLGTDGNGNVYIGGSFTAAGDLTTVDRVVRWNGFAFAHLDINLPGSALVRVFEPSRFGADPVVRSKQTLWLGMDQTGTGTYAGAVTVSNAGSVPAFPIIVFSRSGGTTATIKTVVNERTGQELLFDYDLLDGETLTIDLSPTSKSIVSSFFGSRLDAVLANSDFGTWSLLPNDNNITSFVDTSGSPTITAYILWQTPFDGYD